MGTSSTPSWILFSNEKESSFWLHTSNNSNNVVYLISSVGTFYQLSNFDNFISSCVAPLIISFERQVY